MRLRIGHSPDPDDAFMMWALAEGVVKDPAFEVEVVAKDVQTLNQLAADGKGLDVTALSLAAFADVADEYLLLPFGASFGEGYGPVVVAAQPLAPEDLPHVKVASPGALTTAAAALRLAVGPLDDLEHVAFTDVLPGVKHGLYEAGLLIHEGQITYAREGLVKVLDLGEWWARAEGGLPLPLGVIAIRRDVGEDLLPRAVALVKRSLDAAFENRDSALQYASKFGRGLAVEDVEKFVDMYVTALTREMRPQGARAVERFLARMREAGLADDAARVEFAPEPVAPNPRTVALAEARAKREPVAREDAAAASASPISVPPLPRPDEPARRPSAPKAPLRVRAKPATKIAKRAGGAKKGAKPGRATAAKRYAKAAGGAKKRATPKPTRKPKGKATAARGSPAKKAKSRR